MRWSREINGAIIILIIHTTTSVKPSKDTGPAVFEVINEQSRIDEKRVLPYTNPLAGNSQQNAKIHARHQQDMFNAERKRQQRAQLQRWNMQPPKQHVDSYMKAYQESQESHHLALEQMQTKLKEKRAKTRQIQLKETPEIEPVKITRADAIDKNRNHRSYGSVHVQKKRKVFAYPGASYEQGVTIKPNGNVGLYKNEKEPRSLYTVAIPSKTQYVYPKQYSQIHGYTPDNNLNALTTILGKLPQEHVSQLNTLMHTPENTNKETLTKPIDLYFYGNDPNIPNIEPVQTVVSKPYAPEYITHKDHIPITEEIDDVPDIRHQPQSFFKPVAPTIAHIIDDATVPKNNYYNIQVEQTDINDLHKNIEYISPVTPTRETIIYENPLKLYQLGPSTEGVKYLQSKPTAVQHLTQDGTRVSAYEDSDIHYAANYEFGYRVHDHETGNDFGHHEKKSGDSTLGHYHVLLPDGRMQQVSYSAGPGGFHADISYDHLRDNI